MRVLAVILIGFTMWLLIPAWLLVVAVVLMFMHGATRKPTPKRRKR